MFRDLPVRSWTFLFVGWKEPFGSCFAFFFFFQQPFPSNTFCISPVSMQRSSRVSRFFVSRFPVFGNLPAFPFLLECLRGGVLYSLWIVSKVLAALIFLAFLPARSLVFPPQQRAPSFFTIPIRRARLEAGAFLGLKHLIELARSFSRCQDRWRVFVVATQLWEHYFVDVFAICKNLVNTEYETIITTIITAEKDD